MIIKDEAELYLVAARDNPFVAAWVAVVDIHRLPLTTPISPDDWWESFQHFYDHGLVPNERMAQINIAKTFYGHRSPHPAELDDAMANVRRLRQMTHGQKKEILTMSKRDFAIFEHEEKGLARRSNGLAAPARSADLPAPAESFAIFEREEQQALEPAPTGFPVFKPNGRTNRIDEIRPFEEVRQSNAPLPCVDPRPYTTDINIVVMCCGVPIDMNQEDADILDPDDDERLPSIHEMVLHGRCSNCDSEHHHSVARPVPRELTRG